MEKINLTINHLYADEMNIYGDMGNIITLRKRAEWRGIDTQYIKTGPGKISELKGDIFFMGGGQDDDMYAVFDDFLANKQSQVKKQVEQGKVFLLICGAFQLFGKYFLDARGRQINGLDILPIETKAPGNLLTDRCIGNLVTEISPELLFEIKKYYPGTNPGINTVVGFENHSGQTYSYKENNNPLGKVLYGKGNNSTEKIEGFRYLGVTGSYAHGSLLPKNPHIADWLIAKALALKYHRSINLPELDDRIEWNAHNAILKRFLNK